MKKAILLVGPRAQSIKTGVAIAFDMLIDGLETAQCETLIVNTEWAGAVRNAGKFSLKRMFVVSTCILQTWWYLLKSQVLYMPISTSRLGFVRDLLIIQFASVLKRRIVVHLHGSGLKPFYEGAPKWLRTLIRKTYSRADCCIVLGELLREQFSFIPGWQSKTKVVLNGTPIDEKNIPKSLRKFSPGQGEPWRFLYLSNLMTTKGYRELVEACCMLVEQGKINFRCDFCGEFLGSVVDNETSSIAQKKEKFIFTINSPVLSDYVFYHGTVSGAVKDSYLKKAHVLVLPTYYPWEGQPLSINEALAWATPVVSTRHRGIPEQVINGVNGYFVEPRDAIALVKCLKQFLDGEVPYELLSKNARQRYEENFTNEQHLATLIPLLCDTTKSKS